MTPLNVVICGGGRTGHLSAVLFRQMHGVRVSLLTGCREVIDRHRGGEGVIAALMPDGTTCTAHLDAVSDDPYTLLVDADVVIITVPAHVRPALLDIIGPHLPNDRAVYVGAIPGFCGFDWLAERALATRPNVVIWGMKDVAHTAFDLRPGVSVRMGGQKAPSMWPRMHAKALRPARRL